MRELNLRSLVGLAKEEELCSDPIRNIESLSSLDKILLDKFIDRKLELLFDAKQNGILPLTQRQQTIWSICCNSPNSTRYHIPVLLRLSSKVNVAKLIQAIEKSIQKFPLLAAGVSSCGKLFLNLNSNQSIDEIKLSGLKTQAQELQELQDYIYQPFLFDKNPLFRIAVAQSVSNNYLVMCVHHIIADARSISLFIDRIIELYHQSNVILVKAVMMRLMI